MRYHSSYLEAFILSRDMVYSVKGCNMLIKHDCMTKYPMIPDMSDQRVANTMLAQHTSAMIAQHISTMLVQHTSAMLAQHVSAMLV